MQVVTEYIEIKPPALPSELTNAITAPEIPKRSLKNNDLLQLIAAYHGLLQQANHEKTLIRNLWNASQPTKPAPD